MIVKKCIVILQDDVDMFEFKISVPHEEICDLTIFQYCKSQSCHSSSVRSSVFDDQIMSEF